MVRPQESSGFCSSARSSSRREFGDPSEIGLLVLLAAAQMLESKAPGLASTRGRIMWILLKLGLAYLLIGYTGGLESRYWLVLLLPVVSAATNLGVVGHPVIQPGRQRRLSFLRAVHRLDPLHRRDQRADPARHLPGDGRQSHQHPGRGTAPALGTVPADGRGTGPRRERGFRRPRKRCGAPTAWPRWDSSRRVWRTNCAIRWARSRRPRICSAKRSARKTKSPARWPASSARKWTAPIP